MTIKRKGSQYCVYTKDGSRELGCHPTLEAAQKQLAAVEVSKRDAADIAPGLFYGRADAKQAAPLRAVLRTQQADTFKAKALAAFKAKQYEEAGAYYRRAAEQLRLAAKESAATPGTDLAERQEWLRDATGLDRLSEQAFDKAPL